MVSKKIIITNPVGIHARPAGILNKGVVKFPCSVTIKCKDYEIDAKDILGIMGSGIKFNDEIELICEGELEEEALEVISYLIENDLGE